jgi:dihydroorotate dehydrogenase electron transfer subunit
VALAEVAGSQPVAPSLWLLHLEAPALAAAAGPGQSLLVRCADPDHPAGDPFLPRAYFVFAVDRRAGRLSLLIEVRGRGSAWLAGRRAGDRILAHGPVGREVRPTRRTRHLLLLAEGAIAVAGTSLLAAEAARAGLSVTLIANAGRSPAPAGDTDGPAGDTDGSDGVAVPPELLPADVEYRITLPEAGGLLGALPDALAWADEVVVAAPWSLLETLALLRRARLEPFTLRASLPIQALPLLAGSAGGGDALPCGTGACGVCVVPTGRGYRLACREGPVFPLEALRFDAGPEPGGGGDTGRAPGP